MGKRAVQNVTGYCTRVRQRACGFLERKPHPTGTYPYPLCAGAAGCCGSCGFSVLRDRRCESRHLKG
eukprot:scaffold39983_cov58-Phaeocystis_antarctica.AAC.2